MHNSEGRSSEAFEVVCAYDPDVLKTSAEDFSRDDKDVSFGSHLFPLLSSSGAVDRIYLFAEYSTNVKRVGEGLRFRRWPVERVNERTAALSGEALQDRDVAERLQWAGQIGEFWVIYQMTLNHPLLLALLSTWQLPSAMRQEEILRKRKLDELLLDPQDSMSLGDLVEQFPKDSVGVSFAGEGTMMCIFGRRATILALRERLHRLDT